MAHMIGSLFVTYERPLIEVEFGSTYHPKVVFRTLRSLCLSSSVLVLPLDVTTPCDSYTWNYRELVTLLSLGKYLVMPGTQTTDPWVCS